MSTWSSLKDCYIFFTFCFLPVRNQTINTRSDNIWGKGGGGERNNGKRKDKNQTKKKPKPAEGIGRKGEKTTKEKHNHLSLGFESFEECSLWHPALHTSLSSTKKYPAALIRLFSKETSSLWGEAFSCLGGGLGKAGENFGGFFMITVIGGCQPLGVPKLSNPRD